jgi:cation diffusion facilitator family transporter
MAADSTRAILFALGANAGIAVTKFGAAAYTGSGAMLAEAIHSVADTTNQLLLLLGMKRARREPTDEHPLGFQRVTYFYGMMVALLLFFVGGLFSIYEGWHRLAHPEPLRNATVALLVLGIAIVLESISLWGALREIRKVQAGRGFVRWFRETRQSELMVVAGEDIAALGGLVFAFVAVLLAMATGNPLFDALGSIAVGVLLVVVSAAITLEIKGMIVGESAEPALRAAIQSHVSAHPDVKRVLNIITLQWGEHVVVSVRAEMAACPSADDLISALHRAETSLQQAFPQARWVFFEPEISAAHVQPEESRP